MSAKRTAICLTAALILGLSACNLQVVGPVSGDAVATALARTAIAQTSIANAVAATLGGGAANGGAADPGGGVVAPLVPSDTPKPSLTPSLTPTLAPAAPMVSVSMDTNCRTGPGKVYDMTGSLLVGQSAEIVGREAGNQYWVIRDPKNPGNICWLWGYYATVTGDTSKLPVITPPPTPTPAFTDTPTTAFSVSYIDVIHCGASYAFRFNVQNTGGTTLESIRMVITDNTAAATFTHILNSFRSYGGCGVESNQQELLSGEGGHVANILPGELGYNPAGHSITATITVCTQNGLGGTCISQTLNFTP